MPSHPSSPGFGYVVVSQSQRAEFTLVGQSYYISYLENLLKGNICVWLGPEDQTMTMSVFYIHPNIGIYTVGELFSAENPSQYVPCDFQNDGSMGADISSDTVLNELLNIGTSPCLVFVRREKAVTQPVPDDESARLSFVTLAKRLAGDCRQFLEGKKIASVNAVPSPALQAWFASAKTTLQAVNEQEFLFDPCALLIGLIHHFGERMKVEHKLVINQPDIVGIAVPFIQSWEESLYEQLSGENKEGVVRDLLAWGGKK